MVRHGNGRVRATPRRDIEIEKWGELALSPQSHTFELFYPYLTVEDKGPEEFEGRKVRRFALSLNLDKTLTKESYQLPQSETRLAPVAGWRERAKPLEVNGFILVDVETTVALQSSFRGRLSISDTQSPETSSELTLRFESTIRENNEEISTEDSIISLTKSRVPDRKKAISAFTNSLLSLRLRCALQRRRGFIRAAFSN